MMLRWLIDEVRIHLAISDVALKVIAMHTSRSAQIGFLTSM